MRLTRVTHDYTNKGRCYLPIFKGDLILIHEEHPSGWWTGENVMGVKGVVPSTFLRKFSLNSPPEELLRHFFFIKTAQKFSVDFTYHVPTPLRVGETLSPSELHCDVKSRVNLENGIEKFLLRRETARQRLKKTLENLEGETIDSLLNDGASCEGDGTMLKVSISRGQIEVLDARRRQKLEKVCSLRERIEKIKYCLSAALLQLVDEILKGGNASDIRTLVFLDFLHKQLQIFHETLQMEERKVSVLRERLHRAEDSCREWKTYILDRIALRDAKVHAFLRFFSEQAGASKVAYLQDKVCGQHQDSLRREAEQQLRNLIEEHREKYIMAEDELQYWGDMAKGITDTLKQKMALEQLTEAIQQTIREEQNWWQKVSSATVGG